MCRYPRTRVPASRNSRAAEGRGLPEVFGPRRHFCQVTAADRAGERPVSLRELATHHLVVPPPTTDCGQALLHACRQAGSTPSTPYVTADIAAQTTLARAGLATALIPQMAIDPTAAGIRTSLIEDHPIHRLLFAATRHTDTANPTTTAVIAALRTAAHDGHSTHLPPTWTPSGGRRERGRQSPASTPTTGRSRDRPRPAGGPACSTCSALPAAEVRRQLPGTPGRG
ncbi:LysR substrate-binding domain-containing protein [Streptomyces sp. NPDC048256]|uniref:LysR substrate-binding domain-containing protein n=1 Tax=Streptomyces sp. NPDC048256 TaxID=3154613 RepID=UPI0033DB27DC